ncbi:hypothetical protein KJ780_01705 [Candidatus Micrarchaeota archaeon]|nr:hypothetical protein [Candidatus Micrarchaeota archaeon]
MMRILIILLLFSSIFSAASVTLEYPLANSLTNNPNVTFYWSPSGFGADLKCDLTLDGSNAKDDYECTNGVICDYNLKMGDGTYTWSISCTDGSGTTDSSGASTFTIDTQSPVTEFIAQNSTGTYEFGTFSDSDVNITMSCPGETGSYEIFYCIDNKNLCEPKDKYLFTLITINDPGTSYLRVTSKDIAGNYEPIIVKPVQITIPSQPVQQYGVCGSSDSVMNGVMSTAFLSLIILTLIIAISYAASQATSNPKLSIWAKTELVQMFVSAAFVLILIGVVNSYCSFHVSDIASIVQAPAQGSVDYSISISQGAEEYLRGAAKFAYESTINSRFYLGAINQLESYSIWECPLWCFMSVGGTGTGQSPKAGVSFYSSGFNLLMNSSLGATMSALMHAFFIRYIGSGLFLFLLPLGILVRSVPYMRTFGSIILAVLFAFYVIYPVILTAFYISLYNPMMAAMPPQPNEHLLIQKGDAGGWLTGQYAPNLHVTFSDLSNSASSAAQGFFFAFIIPNLALLAASAAAIYTARLLGEELDLSRLTQMV